jgi:hypothetical protein
MNNKKILIILSILAIFNIECLAVEKNTPPIVSDFKIVGSAQVGNRLNVEYLFSDADGDKEGQSIIVWSTRKVELQRGTSKFFIIPKGYEGDEIGAWIHPLDSRGKEGKGRRASNTYLRLR